MLSPSIFSNALRLAKCNIPPYIIDNPIDISHQLYVGDIFLHTEDRLSTKNSVGALRLAYLILAS